MINTQKALIPKHLESSLEPEYHLQ